MDAYSRGAWLLEAMPLIQRSSLVFWFGEMGDFKLFSSMSGCVYVFMNACFSMHGCIKLWVSLVFRVLLVELQNIDKILFVWSKEDGPGSLHCHDSLVGFSFPHWARNEGVVRFCLLFQGSDRKILWIPAEFQPSTLEDGYFPCAVDLFIVSSSGF